jgi:predicted dehydrogenase
MRVKDISMKYNVCVVGLGSVGGLRKDSNDCPGSGCVLTHCHAVYKLREMGHVQNFYVNDVDHGKRKLAAIKWEAIEKSRIRKYFDPNVDIWIVAVNTPFQYNVVKQIIFSGHKVKAIIVEKPFCSNIKEAKEIVDLCDNYGIALSSNYVRRFSKELMDLSEGLKNNEYGEIMNISMAYTRGFKRDASHAIDFLNSFLGKFNFGGLVDDYGEGYDDFSKFDRTVPVYLNYEKCKNVFLCPADGRKYGVFEMSIFTEKGKILLHDHFRKITFYGLEKEKNYGKFYGLMDIPLTIHSHLENTILKMHLNYIMHLNEGESLKCTAADALKVREIIYNVLGE